MNTLTKFIDFNFSNLTHTDSSHLVEINEVREGALYEIIENETLESSNLNDLTISGSLFSLTTFSAVSFGSCAFFGSKLENCTFRNCNFENCSFEFTNISHCKFVGCTFKNCKWSVSPVKKSQFHHCSLDNKTLYFLSNEDNTLWDCFNNEPITWAEALRMDENALSILKGDKADQDETATHVLGTLLDRFKKMAA